MGSRRGGSISNRALQCYWTGFAAWVLGRTDSAPRRHREVLQRVRLLTLQVGEDLVGLDHGGGSEPVRVRLDQLAWHTDLAGTRGALDPSDLTRVRRAIACARGLVR